MSKLSVIAVVALMLATIMAAIPASAEKISIRGEAFDQSVGRVPAGSVSWNASNNSFQDTIVNQGCEVAIVADAWTYTGGGPAGCGVLFGVPLGIVWTTYNFAPFWYDLDTGQTGESLRVDQVVSDADRQIDAENLIYTTSPIFVEYELSDARANGTGNGDGGDIENAIVNGTQRGFSKIGWLGSEYVALDGAANKLAKLLIEQGGSSTEKQTLQTGNTWTVGDWEIMINSIDARASPRKAWFVLSYKGQKLDDVVVEDSGAGRVYTYVEDSIAGETDVPMFVTYVDSIFSGSTTDMVQFRYTWAISREIQQIKADDDIGVFNVDTAEREVISMSNDNSLTLTENSVLTLGGDMKFEIADDDESLRFFPITEMKFGEGGEVITTGVGTAKPTVTGNVTKTLTATPTTTKPVETATPAGTPVTAATTQKEPGFEAMFAIAGLLAVAYIVLRQRK